MKRRSVVRGLLAVVVIAGVTIGVLAPAGVSQSEPPAIEAQRFSLSIDGYEIASFSELAGITSEVETAGYMVNSDKEVVLKKLPGALHPPSVVLKRGLTGGVELWTWHEAVRSGQMASARRSATLTMYNAEGRPVARYHLNNAWPSKLELAGMKAGASEVLVETVTLTMESLQRVAP